MLRYASEQGSIVKQAKFSQQMLLTLHVHPGCALFPPQGVSLDFESPLLAPLPGIVSQSCTFMWAGKFGSTLGLSRVPATWPGFPVMPEMYIPPAVGIQERAELWMLPQVPCCTAEHPTPSQSCTVLLQGASWSGLDFGCYRRCLLHGCASHTKPELHNVVVQGASWSGLDFGCHWRLLHYSLKRIFAPVLVSAYWDREDSSVHVWVVSDLNRPITGKLVPGCKALSCFVAPMRRSVRGQVWAFLKQVQPEAKCTSGAFCDFRTGMSQGGGDRQQTTTIPTLEDQVAASPTRSTAVHHAQIHGS